MQTPFDPTEVRDVQPHADGWWFLTAQGELFFLNELGEGSSVGKLDIAQLEARQSLLVSPCGRFAAVTESVGQYGVVYDLETGAETMRLNRQDYHCEQTMFPVAFVEHSGRTLIIHGTDWNRLDISDAATGETLTSRVIPRWDDTSATPPVNYLDYFNGALYVSPTEDWIADDGWVWHPIGEVRVWNLKEWLERNVWESEREDVTVCMRDYCWGRPICWVDDSTLAVWGIGEGYQVELQPGIRLFDAASKKEVRSFPGPEIGDCSLQREVQPDWMVFDRWLFVVAAGKGTSVWDIQSGRKLYEEDGFVPRRYHKQNKSFLSIEGSSVLISLVA